ncbi:MAG: hypothetical protein LCH86_17755 [Proteobacteria bacterium]|nr:hypothetical protein [Pseudomonadota bacterium]
MAAFLPTRIESRRFAVGSELATTCPGSTSGRETPCDHIDGWLQTKLLAAELALFAVHLITQQRGDVGIEM